MTLETYLKRLDRALRENPARHPARVAFELARDNGVEVWFAGPEGQSLDLSAWERWWNKGGPDPFVDHDGRVTLRIKASHRISDWVVIDAKMEITGLIVVRRYRMLASWVTDTP